MGVFDSHGTLFEEISAINTKIFILQFFLLTFDAKGCILQTLLFMKIYEVMYMNICELDLMKILRHNPFVTQRKLAEQTQYSLGMVNRGLKFLEQNGYIDSEHGLTPQAEALMEENRPKQAVILAAGFGMRMIPINMETPKALIHVHGEVLIERLIRQLHQVGIHQIYVVVGFMKEQFEYLIDEFGVELVVNPDYAASNNLHSLNLVREHLCNTYILPCDIWCRTNPFREEELYSWYLVKDSESCKSEVRINRKQELVRIPLGEPGNPMIGISYLTASDGQWVEQRIAELAGQPDSIGAFWEEALYQNGKMKVCARSFPTADAVEINTYEQLRELDTHSNNLHSQAISTICQAMQVEEADITEITMLKKGMTNRSFLFVCKGNRYIMRIPGEGTDQLINRREEAAVYHVIKDRGICDDIIYINPDNGYKITRFLDHSRCCDAFCEEDLIKCMAVLRRFHEKQLKVGHTFDIFEKINYYESLWNGNPSVYRDYAATKDHVFQLKAYIDAHEGSHYLTHIDAVPDNFLFFQNDSGAEEIRLIDWEYAAMQDPHVDIAMFCIYAMYDKNQVDRLIDIYFCNQCPKQTRAKIYCYIAASGLLWSNWCEYKRNLGVEFGEYSIRQYRFAKDFYRFAQEQMES